MRCMICGHETHGDYPPVICEGCRSDQAYQDYCELQYELDAEKYFTK